MPQGVKDAYKKHEQADRLRHDEEAKLFVESLEILRKYCGNVGDKSPEAKKSINAIEVEPSLQGQSRDRTEVPNTTNFKVYDFTQPTRAIFTTNLLNHSKLLQILTLRS